MFHGPADAIILLDGEFNRFFNAESGVDIDALWIDMNEASNFCNWPCKDPQKQAIVMGDPPRAPPIRIGSPMELPGFPSDLQPQCHSSVTFNVKAKAAEDEAIVVIGSAVTLGSGKVWDGVQLESSDGGWSATVSHTDVWNGSPCR